MNLSSAQQAGTQGRYGAVGGEEGLGSLTAGQPVLASRLRGGEVCFVLNPFVPPFLREESSAITSIGQRARL